MEHPILVLPYWIKERINVTSLTRNSLTELENSLSDEELVWVMSLNKITPCLNRIAKPLYALNPTERIRSVSSYEMSTKDVRNACGTYLRVPKALLANVQRELTTEVVSNINLHIVLLYHTNAPVTRHAKQLAKQFSDNTSFSRMCSIAQGAILNEYIN